MNRDKFDKAEHRDVSGKDLKDALKGVLLAPRGKARSENCEPTKEELTDRNRLDRRSRKA